MCELVLSRYWQFLAGLFLGLLVCEFTLSPFPTVYQSYSSFIGYFGLGVEAILPIPQILANRRVRSCKGFRFSVLASWLLGDTMKMFWFFTSKTTIPWPFKLCGLFQGSCDCLLGIQYMMYGSGSSEAPMAPTSTARSRATSLHELKPNGYTTASGHAHHPGRRISVTEKNT